MEGLLSSRRREAIADTAGITLLDIMVGIVVLTIVVVSSGGVLAALARQGELDRQFAVVESEVSNVLSLIHAAPFDSIGADLAADGFTDLGGFSYRKGLSDSPMSLTNGYLEVTLRDAVDIPLPDPLYMDVTVAWDVLPDDRITKRFVAVRTR